MMHLKTPEEIEEMKEAGRLSAAVLREVGARVKPGVSTWELDQFAEEYIRDHGGVPTFKGYGGFPGSICASVNDQIVHGIPSKKTILREGDIISIDTGATVNGWVGDNAWTYPVGKVSPGKKELLRVTEECLWSGISAARVGNHLGDIGAAVEAPANRRRFGVVRELVGHGVGHDMHEDPNVPNYGHRHCGMKLRAGMVIAIEPMINLGTRRTRFGKDGWMILTRDGKPSAHFEKTIAITEEGPVLLTCEPGRDRPVND
ncbi:MAG: type I methionyl aminopeptidase [Eggerthellaceae bacterium]|jgi:methionyl aminopeptidase